ncbi:MAG TPA: hypothetical protein VN380_06975 [Thermoanaerobaculia bacterium]|jgi:hypothetical protein|nr:hypothetical protein [Thermoanaerobaculia bacterium]
MPSASKGQSPALPARPPKSTPHFPNLERLPESLEDLFRSLALSTSAEGRHDYRLPWLGFTSWRDARSRLGHFEKSFVGGDIVWSPFNDSESNDGPMSLNAYPGRAFIERITNEGDANLERAALNHHGPFPPSPANAAEIWFHLDGAALTGGMLDDETEKLAKKTVTVTAYVGDAKDTRDCVLDARDYGVGLSGSEMPHTILSLNRGNKKSKPWLTGKHGQGASSTYQYSDLTLIASRKIGSDVVAFTLVEATWDEDHGVFAKTPTYRYLTIGRKVPEITVDVTTFPAGTLVRHIGYTAADLSQPFGENSLYGLMMRSLAQPLFPVWFEMFSLKATKVSTSPGFRRYGRVIRGTVNALDRAWQASLKGDVPQADETGALPNYDPTATSVIEPQTAASKILHRASEYFELPSWDFGGRTGAANLGRVKITYWVADPDNRSAHDVLRNWVDPDKTILMTLDGQTHAEESRAIVTGSNGAKLWAAGKYMVVLIDCNGLDPRARYELFTSTREHAKETPIKKMILEELVRRLNLDAKLQELNVQLAAADVKTPADDGESISTLIKQYLKSAGISFEQLTRKVEKWVEVDVDKDGPALRPEPPPIEAVEPPTFVRWKFVGTTVKLYPGQRYSYLFETDASPACWNPGDQTISKIRVLAHGANYVGAGEMKGGRVRCHFECPETAAVGSKGYIQVQLDFTVGEAKMHRLQVDVVSKPQPKQRSKDDESDEPGDLSKDKKTITVKIRKKDFSEVEIPILKAAPVKRVDPAWNTLGWPHDHHRIGFSVRSSAGKVQLFYNAEFPPFLNLRHRMSKKSLADEFVKRYEIKLILHTIFTLNYEFVDEEEFPEEQRKRLRDLLCATAESLALATKKELELEAKLKSEDGTPLSTPVATDLGAAVAAAEQQVSPGPETT